MPDQFDGDSDPNSVMNGLERRNSRNRCQVRISEFTSIALRIVPERVLVASTERSYRHRFKYFDGFRIYPILNKVYTISAAKVAKRFRSCRHSA